jgi:hypothetical protein
MKLLTRISILLGFFYVFQNCKTPEIPIKQLIVKHVDYNLETAAKVTCDDFEKEFYPRFLRIDTINNEAELREFYNYQLDLKSDPKRYTPDVRIKVFICKFQGPPEILCSNSEKAGLLDGKPVIISDEFSSFIKRICKQR